MAKEKGNKMKWNKPAISSKKLTDGWYKREDGASCLAPGYKLVPKPMEIKTSILNRIKYHFGTNEDEDG